MSDTSLQVRTWIDQALHSDVWIRATQAADAAITACPDTPITTAEDATARRAAWEALGQAIGDTEAAVKPLRSRIHDLRTELSDRVHAVLDPAQARVDVVRRILGSWDAQARVRQAANDAEQRKTEVAAAYRTLVQAQDGADPNDPSHQALVHQGSVFGDEGPQEPQDAPVDPFSAQPTAPAAGPTGTTKKTWVVEILDMDALRAALIALSPGSKLQTALRVHEPTLRKMIANEMGPEIVVQANLDTLISVRSEDRAVRSRKATS